MSSDPETALMGVVDDRFTDLVGHFLLAAHAVVYPHFDDVDFLGGKLIHHFRNLGGVADCIGHSWHAPDAAVEREALTGAKDAGVSGAVGALFVADFEDQILIG